MGIFKTLDEDYDITNEPLTHEFLHDVLDFDLYLGRYTKRLNIANIRFPDRYSMMEWFELRKWNPGGYRFCMLNDNNCTTKSINGVLKYPIKVYTIKDLFTEIQRVYDYIESDGFMIKEKNNVMGIFDIENEITREILKERGYRVVYNITEEHQREGKNYFINVHRVHGYNSEDKTGRFYWYAYVLDGGYDRWRSKVIYSGEIKSLSDLIILENYN